MTASAFLTTLWRDGLGEFGELRMMKGGDVRQVFVSGEAVKNAAVDILDMAVSRAVAEQRDVFFGVLTRSERVGTAAFVPPWTHWLWADVDGKRLDPDARVGKTKALQAVNRFHTLPQIIVDSGMGVHAYWHLDRLEPLDRAQAVMAYIADTLKGDRVHDAPRILRVPGTRNYKYIPAPDVRLLIFDRTTTVRLADFEGYLPVAAPPRVKRASYVQTEHPHPTPDWLPEWLGALIADGVPKGQRSEAAFKVVVWMQRYGYGYSTVEDTFEANPNGIGAKYAEKGKDGPRWFAATWKAAEEAA